MVDRTIKRGSFITGGAHPVEDSRKAKIRKGMYMVSDGGRVAEIPSSVSASATLMIAEMVARLRAVRKSLEKPLGR